MAAETPDAAALEFDYVIVGAGSAGCLLANRLSREHRVLLLEAGGADDWRWIHIPVGYLYCIDNPRTDWCYRTTPDPGLNGRSLGYPRGRVLGGSSSINGMLYLRGQAADYDGWAALGNPGWAWDDVLPLFRDVEDHPCRRQRIPWRFRDLAGRTATPALGRAGCIPRCRCTGRHRTHR